MTSANPNCIATFDLGSQRAREELLFLRRLLIDLVGDVEHLPEIAGALGFSDVFRHPALGADNFIGLNKPPEDLVKLVAAYRALASEAVKKLVEKARHLDVPPLSEAGSVTPNSNPVESGAA